MLAKRIAKKFSSSHFYFHKSQLTKSFKKTENKSICFDK